jgi:hypothetical protein
MRIERTLRGALAGAVAAAVWAAQQPLDKRIFGTDYDDVELLGKAVTRGSEWPIAGLALHMQNGAAFGAAYVQVKQFLPGPPVTRAVAAALAENFASWPLAVASDRFHPARRELEPLWGNWRALAQATWRHVLFGVVLGVLEDRLNAELEDHVPAVPVSTNGHGSLDMATAGAGSQTA